MDGAPTPEPATDAPVPIPARLPWLRLFRVPGAAADPKRLMLAAIGMVLLQAAREGIDRVAPAPADPDVPSATAAGIASAWEWPAVAPDDPIGVFWRLSEPVRSLSAPFRRLFAEVQPPAAFGLGLLEALATVAVWGLIGGAIARIAVVDAARHERVSMREALGFALGKLGPLVGTPFLPMAGVALVTALLAGFGLIYRVPGGATVAGALGFLPLFGGLVLTLIVVGLAAGWPLMPAAVAAEAEDGFDAMSRSFAYVYQRPWLYAGYAAMALVIAGVGLLFVQTFAGLVVHLAAWGVGHGGPPPTVATLFGEGRAVVPPGAAATHGFWLGVVGLLLRAWVYSAFFTAATLVYLLLRLDVDGTPIRAIAYKAPVSPLLQAAAEAAARFGAKRPGVEPPAPAVVAGPHLAAEGDGEGA